jgi:hypothetical protein
MLASVQQLNGTVVALHRTYLATDGPGKAPVDAPKKLTPSIALGATRGAAIRLAPAGTTLALAEGIETALAVIEATGTPTWATVSAAGMKTVELPPHAREVELWADHDAGDAGQKAAEDAAARFVREGRTVTILMPSASDTDWLDLLREFGPEALRAARAAAQPWTEPASSSTTPRTDAGHQTAKTTAPPPRPLGVLLDAVMAFYKRFVVFASHAQAVAVTLWTLHTHTLDAVDVTPYILITSPESESGKTRLQEIAEVLVRLPWPVLDPSDAVVVRSLDAGETMLLDEADTLFADPSHRATLRATLNAGNRRGRSVSRMLGEGTAMKRVKFSVFGAKMIGGLRLETMLLDSTQRRCIPVTLHRRNPATETVERVIRLKALQADANPLRHEIERWATSAMDVLGRHIPADIAGVGDRTFEAWTPLLSIAQLAGEPWAARAKAAMLELHGTAEARRDSLGVITLVAIRDIFKTSPKVITGGQEGPRLTTDDLLGTLVDRDDGPWDRDWGEAIERTRQTGKTPRGPSMSLANTLKPYGITPKKVRVNETTSKQGYVRRDFADAWARYAPTSSEGASSSSEGASSSSTEDATQGASEASDHPGGPSPNSSPPPHGASRSEQRNNSSGTRASERDEVGTDESVFRPQNARQPLQDNKCSDVPTSAPHGGGGKGSDGDRQLLKAVWEAIEELGLAVSSVEIILKILVARQGGPWGAGGSWKWDELVEAGKSAGPAGRLTTFLRRAGLAPSDLTLPDGTSYQGYRYHDVRAAYAQAFGTAPDGGEVDEDVPF